MLHCSSLEVDLQGHEEHEEELVVFVQASDRVRENFVCQVLDNIRNSLLREWRLLGSATHFKNQRSRNGNKSVLSCCSGGERSRGPPGHGLVKQLQELGQGGLVHDVDHAHLCDEKVEDAPAGGRRPELLLGQVDLDLCFRGHV